MQIPPIIHEFITSLINVCPSVAEIWAFGSQVNGGARPNSDWDILIFGDSLIIECVAKEWPNPPENIDILVEDEDNQVSAPWIEEGYSVCKSLSLTEDLRWKLDSANTGLAKYFAKKDLPDGKPRRRWEKAIRIYPEIDH